MNFFQRLKNRFVSHEEETKTKSYESGMEKTRQTFTSRLNDLMARYRTVDEDFFEELEEVLILADVGVMTVMDLIDELKMEVKRQNIKNPHEMQTVISEKLVDIYYQGDDASLQKLTFNPSGLTVILVVGVNGVGKTTSIGKLAYQMKQA